ncbi:hypothetical protein [Aeromonas finlandensis]|uniref:hypothetical protein n=1 Tax=Aeromonas finlandensis TaxID=1543375 RepID=UPI0012E08453|nr:hypothetical protein [Aeromonas finlandensis]
MATVVAGVVVVATDTPIFDTFNSLNECSPDTLANPQWNEDLLIEHLCGAYDLASDFYSQLGGDDGSILPDVLEEYLSKLTGEFTHVIGMIEIWFSQIVDVLMDKSQ